MQISVKAHPGSSQKKIILKDDVYHVYVHAPAQDGKANKEIIELIAKKFGVPKSKIAIKNEHSRNKIFYW